MALSVFLSGVSVDFRDLRVEIANELRKFRNLSISPIIQDDLSEATIFNGALVDKLIANLRSCRLVLCLVGANAGYPQTLDERRHVMSIVKERLEKSFGRSRNTLGLLWERWEEKDLGMTYTQLEFFVASVFSEDTRVRVFYKQNDSSSKQESTNINSQTCFRNFLLDNQVLIDWVEGTDFVRDSVQISVEFAIQLRDIASEPSPQISVRETVTRGILVLGDLNLRRQLTLPHYQNFYQNCVWPRLSEPLVVWTGSSEIQETSISLNKDSQFWATVSEERICIVHFSPPDFEAWTFSKELKLQNKITGNDLSAQEEFLAATADGKWLLTFNSTAGQKASLQYRLWELGTQATVIPANEPLLQPNNYAGDVPAIHLDQKGPSIAIPIENKWRRLTKTGRIIARKLNPIQIHSSHPIFCRSGLFQVRESHRSAAIDIAQKSCSLTSDGCVLFSEVSEGRFVLKRYRCVELQGLFLVATKILGRGIFDLAVIAKKSQFYLQITDFGQQVNFEYLLPSNLTFEKLRIIKTAKGKQEKKNNFQILANEVTYSVSVNGRYSWSENKQYLVLLEEKPSSRRDMTPKTTVYVYKFPTPLSAETATNYLGILEKKLSAVEIVFIV